MPLPRRRRNQKSKDFLNNCMSNPTMVKEFPDYKQRYAVCLKQGTQKTTSELGLQSFAKQAVILNDAGFQKAKKLIKDKKVDNFDGVWKFDYVKDHKKIGNYSEFTLLQTTLAPKADNFEDFSMPFSKNGESLDFRGLMAAREIARYNEYVDILQAIDELIGMIKDAYKTDV